MGDRLESFIRGRAEGANVILPPAAKRVELISPDRSEDLGVADPCLKETLPPYLISIKNLDNPEIFS